MPYYNPYMNVKLTPEQQKTYKPMPTMQAGYGNPANNAYQQKLQPQAPPQRSQAEASPQSNYGVFSPQQTRLATNQAVADSYAANNAYEARKRFNRPGASFGLNQTRNMLPSMVNGRLGAAQAMIDTPWGDTQVNAMHQLGTEMATDVEGLGWGGIGLQQQVNANSLSNARQNMGWSLFNQLMGW